MMDVLDRYERDPFFKELVDRLEPDGFTDDDGVYHDGPTIAGAKRVQRYLDTIYAMGYIIAGPSIGRVSPK